MVHARQRVLPPPAVRAGDRAVTSGRSTLKPDYDLVVINMANAYRALGRDEEAMVGYRRFMELDPKNAQIRYEAAQILIDSGKLDEARTRADAGADARAEAGRRAQRARRRSRCSAATSPARSARFARRSTQKPDVRLAHFNLALLAEQQGDLPRAVAEYKKEIELHPDSYKAAFNLGRLYERVGDRPAQIDAFKRGDRDESQLRGRPLVPGEGAIWTSDRSWTRRSRLARKGIELAPTRRVRAAGPLRDGRCVRAAGTASRSRTGGGARAGARARLSPSDRSFGERRTVKCDRMGSPI